MEIALARENEFLKVENNFLQNEKWDKSYINRQSAQNVKKCKKIKRKGVE